MTQLQRFELHGSTYYQQSSSTSRIDGGTDEEIIKALGFGDALVPAGAAAATQGARNGR